MNRTIQTRQSNSGLRSIPSRLITSEQHLLIYSSIFYPSTCGSCAILWSGSNLRGGGLEGHWSLASRLGERNTQLEKLDDDCGEVLEEKIVVLGIFLNPLFEGLVRNKSHIGRKHHQGLGGLVFVLLVLLVAVSENWNFQVRTCLGPFHFFQFHFSFRRSL